MNPILDAGTTFIANLLSKKSGFNDGQSYMGDFDVDSFVGSNLERAKKTPGTGLKDVTQGLTELVGLGPKRMVGESMQDRIAKSPLTDQWINDLMKGQLP